MGTLLVVEQSSLESRPRGGVIHTIVYGTVVTDTRGHHTATIAHLLCARYSRSPRGGARRGSRGFLSITHDNTSPEIIFSRADVSSQPGGGAHTQPKWVALGISRRDVSIDASLGVFVATLSPGCRKKICATTLSRNVRTFCTLILNQNCLVILRGRAA